MSEQLSAAEIGAALSQMGQFARAAEAAGKIASVVAESETRLAECDAAVTAKAAQAADLNDQIAAANAALSVAAADLAKAKADAKAHLEEAKKSALQVLAEAGERAAAIVAGGEAEADAAKLRVAEEVKAVDAQIAAKRVERAEAEEQLAHVESQLQSAQRALSELRSKVAGV